MSILEAIDYSLADLLLTGIVGMALGILIQGAWDAFAPDGKCVWIESIDGFYRTDCHGLFEVAAGTPKENCITYCPYCGRVIKTKRE